MTSKGRLPLFSVEGVVWAWVGVVVMRERVGDEAEAATHAFFSALPRSNSRICAQHQR